MKFKFDTTTITKDFLLKYHSQETYLTYYLGVPVTKGLHVSCLRNDKRPTAAFYLNKHGDIIFKDFGSDFSGNFVSVVMEKYKVSYYKALKIIANDFGLTDNPKLQKCEKPIIESDIVFKETKSAIIQVEIQNFSKEELEWWQQFGITEKTLKKFRVFSCSTVWLNGNIFTKSSKYHPIFGYYRGKNKEGNELWRIYMPKHRSKEPKFLSNWKKIMLQGIKQLPKDGDLLVITKAMKDVMCLYELGVPAIAPCSENLFITESQYNKLKERFKKIIIFYDFDYAGIHNMNKFRKQFPDIIPYWIPKKYGCKDISDFVKKYGKTKEIYEEIERIKSIS